MPLLALVLLFIALPLAELYVILQVGDLIGVIPTIALLAADSVLGSLLLRSQGRAVWRRFNETLAAGRMPHREAQDGVLVIFGGALLITPGFITDVVGLVLLLPPTRALVRGAGMRMLQRRVERRVGGRRRAPFDGTPDGGRRRSPADGRRSPFDVEGTATDVDVPPEQLGR
jgi:UPF0716 protein FxsA